MKKVIHTTKAPKAVGPYSQAIDQNGILFVSGQIPLDPETGELSGSNIRQQTVRVLQNIDAILSAAGYSKKEVVKCTCLLKNMDDFKGMNEEYARYFDEAPPARAAFQVGRLPLDVLIEIEAIAMK